MLHHGVLTRCALDLRRGDQSRMDPRKWLRDARGELQKRWASELRWRRVSTSEGR